MDKYEAIQAKYDRIIRKCTEKAQPNIIVWGPGRSDAELYKKRECVRKAIQHVVPNGVVIFPEDPKVTRLTKEVLGGGDLHDRELLQAQGADIIIALDLSPAVGEEIARHSANPDIAGKMFVITTDGNKSAYQKAIRDVFMIHVLKADEMDSCEEPIKRCVGHVRCWCFRNDSRK
jgi:hypothetical protein